MPNSLPTSMTSIAIREPGGSDMLVPQQQAVPSPDEGEILVKVAAAGVNRPDVLQRQGHYPPPKGATWKSLVKWRRSAPASRAGTPATK